MQFAPIWSVAHADGEVEGQLLVTAPHPSLAITLQPIPQVSGRLVAGGEPVAGGRVSLAWKEESGATVHRSVRTDVEGRFRLPLPRSGDGGTLSVADARGLAHRSIPLPRRETRDLGEIGLDGGRIVELHVIDASGAPVSGACAFVPPAGLSAPTDAMGVGRVRVPDEARRLLVIAPGCAGRTVRLDPDSDEPTEVELARQGTLELTVHDVHWEPLVGLTVRVFADRPFVWEDPRAARSRFHAPWSTGVPDRDPPPRIPSKVAEFTRRTDQNGWVRLPAIDLGVPFTLELEGAFETIVAQHRMKLDETEAKAFKLRLKGEAWTVGGTVTDEAGRPVPAALVRAQGNLRHLHDTETDAFGRFSWSPVFRLRTSIFVHARSYEIHELRDVDLSKASDLDVVLRYGCKVELRVVDAQGRPVPVTNPLCTVAKRSEHLGKRHADGRIHFTELPPGRFPISFEVHGRRVTVDHDTTVPRLDYVVEND